MSACRMHNYKMIKRNTEPSLLPTGQRRYNFCCFVSFLRDLSLPTNNVVKTTSAGKATTHI
ncbi:hypothetical protein PGIGA_G00202900 [Pangasianodon gigas]|uniref:Uncharacterized protein n=1 Tax=Pangasianodon gigas TaxID=30993 RepID=A0ACC5WER2_PANGG|nr:hypothetical protein [Pangasianodon gigas]